jgi:hypothetical protein
MGFYVELDERNHPFQITPKEATGELAYTAIGEGCHYLNTFIYGTFNTGSMARPERWENAGKDLRAINRAGPLIMASRRIPACAAIYFPYDHWIVSGERYFPSFAYELIRRTFGECDLAHQDVVREKGLAPYRIVALLGTDILTEEDETQFVTFVQDGGVLLLDRIPSQTPSGEPLTRLQEMIGPMPMTDIEEQDCSDGKIIRLPPELDLVYWCIVEREDPAARHRIERDMRQAFSRTGIRPAVSCDDPEFDTYLLDADGASILVAVNHRPEQTTTLVCVHTVAHPVGYACDLSTGEEIPFRREDADTGPPDAAQLSVTLTPRQGILVRLFPEKPVGLSLRAGRDENDLVFELKSGGGYPIPVFIEAMDPEGRKNIRHSRELVLRGEQIIRSPLAVNEPEGIWEICACSPAVGWTESVRVSL